MKTRDEDFLERLRVRIANDPELQRACQALTAVRHFPALYSKVAGALTQITGEGDFRPKAAALVERLIDAGVLCWFNPETGYLDLAVPRLLRQFGFHTKARVAGANDALASAAGAQAPRLPDSRPRRTKRPQRTSQRGRPPLEVLRCSLSNATGVEADYLSAVYRQITQAEARSEINWPLYGKDLAELVAQAVGEGDYAVRLRTYTMLKLLQHIGWIVQPTGADWYWLGPQWPHP